MTIICFCHSGLRGLESCSYLLIFLEKIAYNDLLLSMQVVFENQVALALQLVTSQESDVYASLPTALSYLGNAKIKVPPQRKQ